MSNFINREKYDFLTRNMIGEKNGFTFSDIDTNPKNIGNVIRKLSSDKNVSKLRAYNIFTFLKTAAKNAGVDKPSESIVSQYNEIAKSICKSFVNGYGRYNAPTNAFSYGPKQDLIKVNAELRMKLMQGFKAATGCGNVNIVFKSPVSSILFEEKISIYINNLENVKSCEITVPSIDNAGIRFDANTTLTVVIPMKYIENNINQSHFAVVSELRKDNLRPETIDPKVVNGVVERFVKNVSIDICNAIVAAVYNDVIFAEFSKCTIDTAIKLQKYKMDGTNRPMCSIGRINIPSLNYLSIEEIIKSEELDELNPTILMDILEISNKEVDTFVQNFNCCEEYHATNSPKSYLLRADYGGLVDEESRMSASLAYVTRLNYCMIALMLTTKTSVKESFRTKYSKTIEQALEMVDSYCRSSAITNNKSKLVEEVRYQLDIMDSLASDIIKLKRFVAGDC